MMDTISLSNNSVSNQGGLEEVQSRSSDRTDAFSAVSFHRDREETVMGATNKRRGNGLENGGGTDGGIRRGKWIRYSLFCCLLVLLAIGLIALAIFHLERQELLEGRQREIELAELARENQTYQAELRQRQLFRQRGETEERLESIKLQRQMLAMVRADNATLAEQLNRTNDALELCRESLENATEKFWLAHSKYYEGYEEYYSLRRELYYAREETDENEGQLGEHERAKQSQTEQIWKMESQLVDMDQKIGQTKRQIGERENSMDFSNRTHSELQRKLVEIDTEIGAKDEKIGRLEEVLAEQRQANGGEGGNDANQTLLADLREQLDQKESQMARLEILTMYQQGNDAKANLEIHLSAAGQAHEMNLNSKEETIVELQRQIDALKAQIADKQKTADAKWTEINRLNRCRYYYWWC